MQVTRRQARRQRMTTPFPMATSKMVASLLYFFFNDTATTEIYTLSLHDALPISRARPMKLVKRRGSDNAPDCPEVAEAAGDRKSTRLNSSHGYISYAVFCLK